jgi:hypothetical protein
VLAAIVGIHVPMLSDDRASSGITGAMYHRVEERGVDPFIQGRQLQEVTAAVEIEELDSRVVRPRRQTPRRPHVRERTECGRRYCVMSAQVVRGRACAGAHLRRLDRAELALQAFLGPR